MPVLLKLRKSVGEISWLYVVLFLLLANLPMWIVGGLHRLEIDGWFNLDFLVIGILALFVPRAISAGLLLLAMGVDFMAAICRTYYVSPTEILSNARELVTMPGERILIGCAIFLLTATIAGAAFLLPRAKRRFATAIVLISFGFVCRGINEWEEYWGVPSAFRLELHRTEPQTVRTAFLGHERPARMSARTLMMAERQDAEVLDAAESGRPAVPAESAAALAYRSLSSSSANPHSLPDFVLILVESWGLSSDQAIRQSLVQPYASELSSRFTILHGSVPFHGPTVSGENRELCGRLGGASIIDLRAADLRSCLPDELRDLGFHTIAVHGLNGHFYHRDDWYPRAGFQEIWFEQRLETAGLPDCTGAFRGICDAAVANWIGKRLEQPAPDPRFVYWITLNSHLPVPNPPPLPTLVPCGTISSLADDLALCNWYRLTLNVHQSVALLASQDRARPAVYVIVGDHAPPFSNPDLRSSFDQRSVPYVILLPKMLRSENLASSQPGTVTTARIHHPG